jgi:hypothetical protein
MYRESTNRKLTQWSDILGDIRRLLKYNRKTRDGSGRTQGCILSLKLGTPVEEEEDDEVDPYTMLQEAVQTRSLFEMEDYEIVRPQEEKKY